MIGIHTPFPELVEGKPAKTAQPLRQAQGTFSALRQAQERFLPFDKPSGNGKCARVNVFFI